MKAPKRNRISKKLLIVDGVGGKNGIENKRKNK